MDYPTSGHSSAMRSERRTPVIAARRLSSATWGGAAMAGALDDEGPRVACAIRKLHPFRT